MRLLDRLPGRRSPVEAYLSLGSNVGDRDAHLVTAIGDLAGEPEIVLTGVSGVYETAPVGGVEQDAYLNAVVAITTTLSAHELLRRVQSIEAAHGRDRAEEQRWGPRPLDIDVVLFGPQEVDEPDLVVPHPRMHERAFVLIPLMEVAPGLSLPDGTRLSALVNRLAPIEGVELAYRLEGMPGDGPGRPAGPNSPDAVLAADWTAPRGAPGDISDLPTRGTER